VSGDRPIARPRAGDAGGDRLRGLCRQVAPVNPVT
jgi:hypothetical protein